MNQKQKLVLGAAFLVLTTTAFLSQSLQTSESSDLTVAATFYPTQQIAEEVVGQQGEVETVIPPGTTPHGFEPSPSDMELVSSSDAYIATGVTFSEMERSLTQEIGDERVIEAGENISLRPARTHHAHESSENHKNNISDESMDPHYWVSPENAIQITRNIEEEMKRLDPGNAEAYEENADSYVEELQNLSEDYDSLSTCEKKTIVTSHAAFGYVADQYNLTQVPIMGLSPTSEPSPGELENLIETAEKNNLYEKNVDPRVSEVIANEVGAETLTLDPVVGAGSQNGYIPVMRQNLQNLETALECQS